MFRKIFKKSIKVITYYWRLARLEKMFDQGLPRSLHKPLRFLLDRKTKKIQTKALIHKIEKLRKQIVAKGKEKVSIIYSPKQGYSEKDTSESARPKHGEILEFTMEQVARTGKNKYWGTFLHLLAYCSKSKTIVELGSCVGISGCYLSASPFCEQFITVEGSNSLASLAEKNLRQISDKYIVYKMLFDEAMDIFLPKLETGVDFVFIDGHHEKIATIHYFERIKPKLNRGAIVVFDDILWSNDMREAWDYLSRLTGFVHALDLGVIGICIWDGETPRPQYWTLQPLLGKVSIGKPHGWQK